jgi:hypothetical protein
VTDPDKRHVEDPAKLAPLDLQGDLAGEDYRALLRASPRFCTSGLLVQAHRLPLNASGMNFLDKLAPFVSAVTEQLEWPGTKRIGDPATVYYFTLTQACVELLAVSAESIFDWSWPDRLEDLALLRRDESTWFGSVSHERDAWLNLTAFEVSELMTAFPRSSELFQKRPNPASEP